MPRLARLVAVISALVVSLGALTVPAALPASAADPVRILVTGDSITHGYHGDFTWRYRLAKEFTRQAAPVDFVGSYSQPFIAAGYTTTRYLDPAFDSRHFARVGAQLNALKNTIGPEVTTHRPEIVVLAAGLNDLIHGASPAETNQRLEEWIDNARLAKPDVKIILSPVLTIDRANFPDTNAAVAAYNRLLRFTAMTRSNLVSPIVVADTDRDWNPRSSAYAIDGIHAAPTGETIIAQRIGEALQGLGVLPATPQIARTVAWSRTLRPRVSFRGTRATITWYAQKISGATVYVHRYRSSKYRYYSGGRAVVSVVPGVRYTFRLRLKRDRVTGPWGPILTVRAPRA